LKENLRPRKIESVLREMRAKEGFRIIFSPSSNEAERLLTKMGIRKDRRAGPRYVFNRNGIMGVDLGDKIIRKFSDELFSIAKTHDVEVCFRVNLLPLQYANKDELNRFLRTKGRTITYLATSTLLVGAAKCLENVEALTQRSDRLADEAPAQATFFTIMALEELGKVALIADSANASGESSKFVQAPGFRDHTKKMLRAIEALAGTVERKRPHHAERKSGALQRLLRESRVLDGHGGSGFYFMYVGGLWLNFEMLRDMGEFLRESSIYVEYNGLEKNWHSPRTSFLLKEIKDLNETLREYAQEYARNLDKTTGHIPRLENIVPKSWAARLEARLEKNTSSGPNAQMPASDLPP